MNNHDYDVREVKASGILLPGIRRTTPRAHARAREGASVSSPDDIRKCLFADAVDPEQFREDHERFVDVLRSEGVKVHLVTEIVRDRNLLDAIRATA